MTTEGAFFTLLFVTLVILAFAADARYERQQRRSHTPRRHDGTNQAHRITR